LVFLNLLQNRTERFILLLGKQVIQYNN